MSGNQQKLLECKLNNERRACPDQVDSRKDSTELIMWLAAPLVFSYVSGYISTGAIHTSVIESFVTVEDHTNQSEGARAASSYKERPLDITILPILSVSSLELHSADGIAGRSWITLARLGDDMAQMS